jgi:MOSC domain-containing protein YiiM
MLPRFALFQEYTRLTGRKSFWYHSKCVGRDKPMPVVEAIYITDVATTPLRAVSEVTARAGVGLEGDRYAHAAGTFSSWPNDHQFTLIEAEAIEAVAREYGLQLAPGESRRNVTTRGIALNPLVGKRFRVGEVLCEGTRLCEPCAHLEVVTGKGGLARMMAGRCGLRALLLTDGVIRVGDPITLEDG